jgi:hypothetical protein
MLRTALAMFMISGTAAWGESQTATSVGDKVDRATAYYHYTLAHMYAEMAASSESRNSEYVNKSIENYKAAVKADPRTPPILLQGPGPGIPLLWLPATHPARILPKADPSK